MIMLPLQSGSDRILRLMRRDYTAAEVSEKVKAMRAACPDAYISTHALVGLPGETDADFEQTANLLKSLEFDRVDVYKYSERPGTEALELPDKVPQNVIEDRAARLTRQFA